MMKPDCKYTHFANINKKKIAFCEKYFFEYG